MSGQRSYIWPNLSGGPVLTDKQGIDFLIVAEDQTRIEAHFLKPAAAALANPAVYRIEGGDRVKTVAILQANKKNDRVIELVLDRFGDWAPYRLAISEEVWTDLGIDPVFSRVSFSFKVNCPNDLDCKAHLPGFEKFPASRSFDYQAKDYESFKQAMLDRLSLSLPDWRDQAEADFGIALVDLLAFVGDRLSYYQDRVASENLLATARARQSVSGHLKLIDYALDPGETATAAVYFEAGHDVTIPAGAEIETPAPDVPSAKPVTFTLRAPFSAYRDLNRMKPYDFSHPSLAIPKGAVQAAIIGHPEGLARGSSVALVRDFRDTQDDEDAATAPGKRKITGQFHIVTLSSPPAYKQSSDGTDFTVLTWDESGALPWEFPLSGGFILGNIARLRQGKAWKQSLYVDGTLESFDLPEGPLGYQNGEPMIRLAIDGEAWTRVPSLRESRPYDMHYQVVDLDNEKNRILFGDNVNGFRPERNSIVEIEYLAGIGTRGNVAAGTLTRLPAEVKGVTFATNLLAAENGRDPESEEHGKRWGPKKIRQQERAVTLADYEREAMRVPGVSRAMARFVWTGSWITVRVTVDPEGTEELTDALKAAVFQRLRSRKMAGYDIQLFPVRYVPLEIRMRFCLNDRAFRDQVFRDLNSALGNDVGADGVKGLFHPDNWTFGRDVNLSALYASAARVQGVECAEVTLFKRLRKPQGDELEKGLISMQWDEIARMDNDRDFPERGMLDLELAGGR